MKHKLFNLYFDKLLNTKLLANVQAEKYAAVSKIFFCEPSVKYIEILVYSNMTMLFAGFL